MITMNDVKNELARAGITQKEFSEMLGVSLTAIQKWFNGTSHPTMKRYTQILEVLGLDDNNKITIRQLTKELLIIMLADQIILLEILYLAEIIHLEITQM